MRRWWEWMGPLMETNPDGSPLSLPLETVFHLK
jgi:L-rhamnose mutarotase